MIVRPYGSYGVLDVFGYWEREADEVRLLDSSVWSLEAN